MHGRLIAVGRRQLATWRRSREGMELPWNVLVYIFVSWAVRMYVSRCYAITLQRHLLVPNLSGMRKWDAGHLHAHCRITPIS